MVGFIKSLLRRGKIRKELKVLRIIEGYLRSDLRAYEETGNKIHAYTCRNSIDVIAQRIGNLEHEYVKSCLL